MSERPTFLLDGEDVPFTPGQTVLQAALAAGRYIPHLCYHPEFTPHGSCKVCTARVNGRTVASCTTPAESAIEVESNTEELNDLRRTLVQMLFAEGNHFCPSCEKSGNCVLQALGYDLGVMTAGFRHLYPDRPVDASHPELLLDFNRCVLCELCVRASRDVDGKSVFALSGRGLTKHLIVNSESGLLADTDIAIDRQGGGGLPGGRDPAQARRLRRAHRPASLRPAADQRAGAGRRTAPAGRRRSCLTTHAMAGTAPRKLRSRDHLARRLLRLPHVAARHRRAALHVARARRVRPLAAHRHQALRALRHRHRRGRALQRRERARAARVPRQLQGAGGDRAPARSPAACRHSAITSTSGSACRRSTSPIPVSASAAFRATRSCRCRSTRCTRCTRSCGWTTSSRVARPRATRSGNSSPTWSRAARRSSATA